MCHSSGQFDFFHIINVIPDAEQWIQFSDEISDTWITWEIPNKYPGRKEIKAVFSNLTESIISPYK